MNLYLISFCAVVFVMVFVCFSVGNCSKKNSHETCATQKQFSLLTDFFVEKEDDLSFLFPSNKEDLLALAATTKQKFSSEMQAFFERAQFEMSFDEIVLLDKIVALFSTNKSRISLLWYVHPDQQIIDLATKLDLELGNFFNETFYSKRLFTLVHDFIASPKFAELQDWQKYQVQKAAQDLFNFGCSLNAEQFKEVKRLQKLIEEKSTEFSKNIFEYKKKVYCSENELEGISLRFLQAVPRAENGDYEIGTSYPIVFEILKYCHNEETRKKVWLNFSNVGYPANDSTLSQIVAYRNEMAGILNYPDFASLGLCDKMAKSPQAVRSFLLDLAARLQLPVDQEVAELLKAKPDSVKLTQEGLIEPWNLAYLQGAYEKQFLSLDDNLVAEYFPLDHSLQKMFDLYQNLLGLKFELVKSPKNVWHEDVFLIKVFRKNDDQCLGFLYIDLFPREKKYNHACLYPVVVGFKNELYRSLPVACVIANFSKPDSSGVALLKHSEVETFFHEFGHAMHAILGGHVELGTVAGTNVLLDFVEAPSQMFQEWMWQPEILASITSHYKTNEPLPEPLISAMLKKRTAFLANFVARQIHLAFFSLECYSKEIRYFSFNELRQRIAEIVPSAIVFHPEAHSYASFGHLTGYGAGYYSYLWSEVFAKDLWSEVKKRGLSSPLAGSLIVDLLSQGGMKDPSVLLTDVLKREVSSTPFEEYLLKKQ